MNKSLVSKGLSELKEQSQIVADTYGGSALRRKADMVWCLLRYAARPIDHVRLEYYKNIMTNRIA